MKDTGNEIYEDIERLVKYHNDELSHISEMPLLYLYANIKNTNTFHYSTSIKLEGGFQETQGIHGRKSNISSSIKNVELAMKIEKFLITEISRKSTEDEIYKNLNNSNKISQKEFKIILNLAKKRDNRKFEKQFIINDYINLHISFFKYRNRDVKNLNEYSYDKFIEWTENFCGESLNARTLNQLIDIFDENDKSHEILDFSKKMIESKLLEIKTDMINEFNRLILEATK